MRGIQIKSKKTPAIVAGYHANYDGATLANRDVCTGEIICEDGRAYFVCLNSSGEQYETAEMPCIRFGT